MLTLYGLCLVRKEFIILDDWAEAKRIEISKKAEAEKSKVRGKNYGSSGEKYLKLEETSQRKQEEEVFRDVSKVEPRVFEAPSLNILMVKIG